MADVISGKDFLNQICEAIDINPDNVRRVVLDIKYNDVITVYVEQLGTDKLLNINMNSDGIKLSEISTIKKVGENG